jgi:short-subunit dehydrogenase
MGVYNVSKHAVVALSESLYQDLRLVDAPISASVLCPFYVPTGINQSHRNRPEEVSNRTKPTVSQLACRAMTDKAVASGKVSAAQVAEWTFDAIRDDKFYIYSHPGALASVQTRMEDIMMRRNPSDPFAGAPQVRDMLQSKLKLK